MQSIQGNSLIKTLVVTFLILSIYIFIQYLVNGPKGDRTLPQFHMGCYEDQHRYGQNFSVQVRKRLQLIKDRKDNSSKVAYMHRSIVANQTHFSNQLLMVHHNFDQYLKQLVTVRSHIRNNQQLLFSLKQAQKQYKNCHKEINDTYDQSACIANWRSYERCFDDTDEIHNNLQKQIGQEKYLKARLEMLMRKPNSSEPGTRLIEKQYHEKIENNNHDRQLYLNRLDQFEKKKSKYEYQETEATEKYDSVIVQYNECVENRKLFLNCKEISKSINKLDYGSMQLLRERILNKQKMINNLMHLMGQPEDQQSMQYLKDEILKHQEEHRRMLRALISTGIQITKACGCTQEYEKKLEKEVTYTRSDLMSAKDNIAAFNDKIDELRIKVKRNQQEKEGIVEKYKKYLNKSISKENYTTELLKINQEIKDVNYKIMKFKRDYQQNQRKCNLIMQRMSSSISEINKIQNCLRKKEYYEKFKEKVQQHMFKEDEQHFVKDAKEKLLQSFDFFE